MAELAHEVVYPESDGQPLAETPEHGAALMDLVLVLGHRFRDRPDVYVGGNQLMYWEEGNPARSVAPDVYLALGRPKRPPRRTWKVWEEGAPTLIVEITSSSSKDADLHGKWSLYQALGVREYAIFDPLGEYLQPRLRLWRLEGGQYVEVAPGEHGRWSEVLLAWLDIDGGGELVRLRERDGAPVLRAEERFEAATARAGAATARAEVATAQAEVATARAEAATARAEAATARAEAEAARAESEAARAESEAARAESEAARADAEAERAGRAEAERDRWLAELERLRGRS